MKSTIAAAAGLLAAAALVVFVPTWTPRPVGTEVGFPQQIQFTDAAAEKAASNQAPSALPPAVMGGPSAIETYRNVQVLTDISAAEFMRLQTAMTNWISPAQGCGFCHIDNDFASDAKPTKATARVMLRMTRHLNTAWSSHGAGAGVTCFTCHRGQAIPGDSWFPSAPRPKNQFIGRQENWREDADTVRNFFPDNGFAEYLIQNEPIAAQSTTIEPSHTVHSAIEVKRIYEVMMQMSEGIGANCGLCHNSRAFASWEESTPYRWIGFDAIRMVRDLNRNFLLPVNADMPQTRTLVDATNLPVIPDRETGAQNGNGLVVCRTCHQGVLKPLGGVNMVKDYPGLVGPAQMPLAEAPQTPPRG